MRKITIATQLVAFIFLLYAQVTFAYTLSNNTISGGGTEATSSNYTLKGTVGQSTIGVIDNETYTAYIGYWEPGICVEVEEDQQVINAPKVFSLSQNYPNPMNLRTTIMYGIPKTASVSLRIYNITGQVIRTFNHSNQKPGFYKIRWDGTNAQGRKVATGIYFYRMETDKFKATKKLTILK